MNSRIGVAAFALALAVAGCASSPIETAGRCTAPGVCKIDVSVADCQVTVKPDTVDAYGKNLEIHWDIVSPGYAFTPDGIAFKDDPTHEFHDPHRPQPKKFTWHDKNTVARPAPFPYSVRVTKDGTPCPPTDPGIINHG